MEHTTQQQAAFRDAYTKRFRRKFAGIVILFAAMTWLAFLKGDVGGVSDDVLGPIVLVAVVVGWFIFESRNWLCPACNGYLGREFNPRQCRKCGAELRAKKVL